MKILTAGEVSSENKWEYNRPFTLVPIKGEISIHWQIEESVQVYKKMKRKTDDPEKDCESQEGRACEDGPRRQRKERQKARNSKISTRSKD